MEKIYVFYCLLYGKSYKLYPFIYLNIQLTHSIIHDVILAATWTEGADIYEVAVEGRNLSFQCSHSFAWKNNKYFCKDPCKTNKDILVTVQSGQTARAERITLVDSGNGVFSVTFNQLRLSDMGRYWCAVDRPGFDTFTAVHLTVKEGMCTMLLLVLT